MLELVNVGLTLLGLPLGLVLDGLILRRGETHGPHHFLCISRIFNFFNFFDCMVAMIRRKLKYSLS